MYDTLPVMLVLYQQPPLRYTRTQRCHEGQVAATDWGQSHYVRSYIPVSAIYLTYTHRTLYESKGLEFNDVSLTLPHIHLYQRTKVLLYNFFEDSTATSNQWRLVLNMVSKGGNSSYVPTFGETRHAIICMEVCCLSQVFLSSAHATRVRS